MGLQPLEMNAMVTNKWGKEAKSLVADVSVSLCTGYLFGCGWIRPPVPKGFLNNLDPCSHSSGIHLDDCHFASDPTFTNLKVGSRSALHSCIERSFAAPLDIAGSEEQHQHRPPRPGHQSHRPWG